jgi:hypothetical protein
LPPPPPNHEFELFKGLRCCTQLNSDITGDGSITFDHLEEHVKRAFNFPPLHPELGPGYLGHFAFKKFGPSCAVCRMTTESSNTLNGVVVESLDFWDQVDILVYLIHTTHGKE